MKEGVIETRQEFKPYKSKVLSIEQYFDPEIPNLGLEKYGMSLMEDGGITEDLGSVQFGNQVRYLTGLDINADYIRKIQDPREREAEIKQIEDTLVILENLYGKGTLDPTNKDFWRHIKIELKGYRKYIDLSDPQDLILYHCIKAGGFSEIASSYEQARSNPNKVYKYYLQELEEISAVRTEVKKERNAAKAELTKLYTKEPAKLIKLAKVLLTSDHQFSNSTPLDLIYDKLDDFIDGVVVKTNKKRTPGEFMEAAKLDRATLNLKALTIDAIYHKFIYQRSDMMYYNRDTGSMYGRNLEEVIAYLKNPINNSELENITEKVEAKWNR